MPYTPFPWEDNKSAANAAHLNHIEEGLGAAAATAEEGKTKAESALTNATTNKTLAEEGKTKATEAKTEAIAAQATATSAQSSANAAKTEAKTASEAATAAQAALNAIVSTPGIATTSVSLGSGERVIAETGENTTIGEEAKYGAWSPDGQFLYVTSSQAKTLYVFKRNLINGSETELLLFEEIVVGLNIKGVAVSPNGKYLHVCAYLSHKILGWERSNYSGELKGKTEVVVENLKKEGAELVHLAYSPDSKFLYAIGEEQPKEKGGIYQFKIETNGEVKGLTPTPIASTEAANCNQVICTKGNLYVAYENGILEFTRNEGTGICTKVAIRGSEVYGSIAISPDLESMYATNFGNTRLTVFTLAGGVLTEGAHITVTGCRGVAMTSDGKTVMCCDTTNNVIVGFDRKQKSGVWEIVRWAETVAAEVNPRRILPNPDNVNMAVIHERTSGVGSQTVKGYRRFVQVKVTSAFVAAEGESGRGIQLSGQGGNVKGKLSPIKQVAKTSFYVESDKPSDTGTVLCSLPTESNPVQPVESPETGTFKGFTAANQPPANFVPYAAGSVFNIPLGTASPTLISNSAEMVKYVLSLGSVGQAVGNMNERGSSKPVYYASSTDPLYKIIFQEPWGANVAAGAIIHIPESAIGAEFSEDKHMSVIQPDGTEYCFWHTGAKVAGSPGSITAAWGGIGGNYLTAPGNGIKPTSGATGGGFNVGAGIIRYSELAAATLGSFETINHGLFVVVKHGRAGPIPPSTHSDGEGPEEAKVPYEGQRFCLMNEAGTALLSKTEIEAVTSKAWQRAVLSALARYGCINGDKGGPGFGWQLESQTMYTAMGQTNPWKTYGAANGLPTFTEEGVSLRVYKLIEGSLTQEWWEKHLKAITCKE